MDIATLIGLVVGLGLIVASMASGGSLAAFFNVPGLLIVVGGTFAALFVKESMGNVLGAAKVMMNAFFARSQSPETLIPIIVDLATKARKEGLVALDGVDIDDPFVARGVQLGVDGLSPEVIKGILASEIGSLRQRHMRGKDIFKFLESTAPAMGMIGTLIGLVQMLKTISDPSAIGPAMAVALLTTLYGAILAFLMFGPIAGKLQNRSQEETARKALAIAGVEAILNGESSMVIQSKLASHLAPKERAALEASKA